jgi:hypothetical protein
MPIERLTRAGATSVLGARDSFTHKMPGQPRNIRIPSVIGR